MRSVLNAILFLLLSSVTLSAQSSTISGIVSEKKSGETIVGATVMLFDSLSESGAKPLRGVYTNKYGFYTFTKIPAGNYFMTIHAIGFDKTVKQIVVKDNFDYKENISLESKDIRMDDIVVTAEKENATIERISTVSVSPLFVAKMPSLGGEVDVFRTLQLMPGIKQANELSAGLYVRGGSPDQNLTLLDGVIVYNPTHLGGFLSSFNNDALKDIRMIKGAFPAEYGGRMSSVLDMSMKEGTKEKLSGSGGISMISSRLTLEGPVGDDVTFMVSGRRMYLDLLLALANTEDTPDYYFYDLNAKVNYKISDNDRLFLSGYFGRDVLGSNEDSDDEGFNITWGNSTGNLRWMHIISPELFTDFSAIYTDYKFETGIEQKTDKSSFNSLSQIQDFTLKGSAQYFPNDKHKIKTGIEATYHNFTSSANFNFQQDFRLNQKGKTISAVELSVFAQDEWQINDKFFTNLGGRFFYFDKGNYIDFEPRLSATYKITDDITFKTSAAIANQFLHLIVRNDITLPTDLWFPSTQSIKPAKSWQAVAGFETLLGENNEYLLSIEGYYKSMSNLYEYKDSSYFSLGVPLESQFTSGTGNAYGVEVFLNKRIGSLTGWIGYTLAWTKRKFEELNEGKEFYPRYDRRHDVSVVLTYELGEKWELGASWVYGTGQAYTMPTGIYLMDFKVGDDNTSSYYDKYQFTDRNGSRLPSFHKLDLNFMYKYTWFGLPFQLSLNVYNAYNKLNPFMWYIGESDDDVPKKVIKQVTLFPLIPTLGLSFKF